MHWTTCPWLHCHGSKGAPPAPAPPLPPHHTHTHLADGLVGDVNHDHLKVLVHSVLQQVAMVAVVGGRRARKVWVSVGTCTAAARPPTPPFPAAAAHPPSAERCRAAAAHRTHLVHPVAVEHAQAAALAAHPLLRDVLQVARRLQLRDTLVHRLSVHDTLQQRASSACGVRVVGGGSGRSGCWRGPAPPAAARSTPPSRVARCRPLQRHTAAAATATVPPRQLSCAAPTPPPMCSCCRAPCCEETVAATAPDVPKTWKQRQPSKVLRHRRR